MENNNFQETEIKFYIHNLPELEKRLQDLDAVLLQPRTHEMNWRFDSPDHGLTKSYQVLRLRRDKKCHLTYKGPADPNSEVSVRKEIEFEVNNSQAARQFLEALGFQVSVMYEKFRTVYRLDSAEISLDEMPYGNFVEIEAPKIQLIKTTSEKLDLNWGARCKLSYLALFNTLREKSKLSASDLLFEEMQGTQFSAQDFNLSAGDG